MYLKSIEINNFRKFGNKNNKISFVNSTGSFVLNGKDTINVAPTTTLIVGKNNSGKTTIIRALEKLINQTKIEASDFNYLYLLSTLEDKEEVIAPSIDFKLLIGLDDDSSDLITNLIPFMTIENTGNSTLEIHIKYEIVDIEIFKEIFIESAIHDCSDNLSKMNKYIDILEKMDFTVNYYNVENEKIKYSLKDLIEIKSIQANNVQSDKPLSKAFSKIVEYRYRDLLSSEEKNDVNVLIDRINYDLTSKITENHTDQINASLLSLESPERLRILLSSDLTFQKIMSNLLKYEYIEKGLNIPETQYGLGYTNLMMIVADLIDYMEKYPERSFNSKINLISIEEPETFMHPQMQEQFIKNINDAINALLKGRKKNINSQLIITTHSSHILNSKISSGNTFNNINYVTTVNGYSDTVFINDKQITPDTENSKESLKFLKKHIKYKVSELFFSDAVIVVEGVTEETILRYFLDHTPSLKKYYISIFNINGAHGLMYHKLLRLLKIPSLIITDIDIKRSDSEKKKFEQINTLKNRMTTNATIRKYFDSSGKIESIPPYIEIDNLFITYQNEIESFYPTSFEEAFILTNFKNSILHSVLEEIKPRIYSETIGADREYEKLKANSYLLQKKLSDSKSDFSSNLLYKSILNDDEKLGLKLPEYIGSGFKWLEAKLGDH